MTFPLTPAQLAEKKCTLAQNGITITGDSGSVSSHGCVIAYSYDGAALTLRVLSHPWYLATAVVEEKLAAFFQ